MKKTIAALLVLLVAGVSFALEVDKAEISPGSDGSPVTFINYTGPHDLISSVAEITGIGTGLGKAIQGSSSAGDPSRYYVIHAVDPAVKTGFDADILVLGADSGVDHIDNLRRIISGYLTSAYGYSAKDASTLSTFITVYNAVYRGKLDVFKSRYKPVVTDKLSADKAGLSVRYDEWAGRTQIVIPLSDPRLAGTISSIDTTPLTDKAVVTKLKEDAVKATDTRKDMADLKAREGDAAQTRAETAQTTAAAARTDAVVKKGEAQKAVTEATAAKVEADKAAQVAAANPADAKAQETAAKTAAVAEQKTAVAEAKTTEAAKAQETVTKNEAVANADQTLADTKQKEALTERKDIASDVQKELDTKAAASKTANESALASASPAVAIKIEDEKELLGSLVLVNLNDGSVMKTSSLNTVRGRTMYDTGSGLIAIAGKKAGNAAIRLVLVDPATLEVQKQGNDPIAEQSQLVASGNDYYAVTESASGSALIGRFDKNLDIKAKSALEVSPATAIIVTDKGILVQDKKGAVKLLRATDLTDVTK